MRTKLSNPGVFFISYPDLAVEGALEVGKRAERDSGRGRHER